MGNDPISRRVFGSISHGKKAKFRVSVGCKIKKIGLEDGMQHTCFMIHQDGYICEWGLFAAPMHNNMRKMWRLMLHTLYFICCISKQDSSPNGDTHTSIHVRGYPISAFQTIASIRLCSQSLKSDERSRMCTLFPKEVGDSKFHTLIQHSTFDHILYAFYTYSTKPKSLHKFLSQSQCELSIAIFIRKVLEQQE